MSAARILRSFGAYFVDASLALNCMTKKGAIPTKLVGQYTKDPITCC